MAQRYRRMPVQRLAVRLMQRRPHGPGGKPDAEGPQPHGTAARRTVHQRHHTDGEHQAGWSKGRSCDSLPAEVLDSMDALVG